MSNVSKNLRVRFKELLSHLNAEENELALEFAEGLDKRLEDAEDDALWRNCLENGGVDNWCGHYDSLKEGGYYPEEGEDE